MEYFSNFPVTLSRLRFWFFLISYIKKFIEVLAALFDEIRSELSFKYG